MALEALSDGAVKMGMQRHMATQMAAQIMMVSLIPHSHTPQKVIISRR